MHIKEKITEKMQLPKEIVLNYPKMTVMGKNEIVIENLMGLIEFSDSVIRINTETHLLKITGVDLEIKYISLDCVKICGIINILELE